MHVRKGEAFLVLWHIASFTGCSALLLLATVSGFTDLRVGFNCFLIFGILVSLNLARIWGIIYSNCIYTVL